MALARRRTNARKVVEQKKSKVIKVNVKAAKPKSTPASRAAATKGSKSASKAKINVKTQPKASKGKAAPQKAPKQAVKTVKSKKAEPSNKKVDAAPKKASKREAPQVLKRPAKADAGAPLGAAPMPRRGAGKTSKAEESAPAAVLKRPARAASSDDAVLKRQAKAEKPGRKASNKVLSTTAADFDQFNKDMDVENLIQAQVRRETARSFSPAPMTPPNRLAGPAPTTPQFARSPTVPACFALNMADLLGDSKAPSQPQKRGAPAFAPPKSWNPGVPRSFGASAPRSPGPAPRSPGGPRRSSVGSLFGDNLDDLLPGADQLRLRGNVPKECFDRAQRRRQSASRDLRTQVGLPASTAAPSTPPRGDTRPMASPTRTRSFGAPTSEPFESSPSRRRTLSGAPSDPPPPDMGSSINAAGRMSVSSEGGGDRIGDAMMAAGRILSIRQQRFPNQVEWGFAVLDKPARDLISVQKAYRSLMRPLHPDRAGSQAEVVRAVDLLREAKELCERALRQQNPPDRPTRLTSSHLCKEPGRRRFKVQWKPPHNRPNAPVHRYIVAVYDPSYGKALAVGTLEPDYSQEYKRYLSHDDPELCSYVVSEEDLRKMPNLFKTDSITVQVAAGNNEGQSDWSVLKVQLHEPQRRVSQAVSRPSAVPSDKPASKAKPSNVQASTGATTAPTSRPSVATRTSANIPDEDRAFDIFVEQKSGRELHSWLQQQKKEKMQGWLKRRFHQVSGSKEAILNKIVAWKEDNPW